MNTYDPVTEDLYRYLYDEDTYLFFEERIEEAMDEKARLILLGYDDDMAEDLVRKGWMFQGNPFTESLEDIIRKNAGQ